MSRRDVSFVSAIESSTRDICIEVLRDNPDTTVGEIQKLCRGEYGAILATITLGELSGAAPAKGGSKAAAAKPAAKGRGAAAGKRARAGGDEGGAAAGTDEVDTRTPAGRKAFDEAVFAAIQAIGEPAGAGVIQRRTGGTNLQVRAACNRLIEAGRISWSGQARGTKYFLTK